MGCVGSKGFFPQMPRPRARHRGEQTAIGSGLAQAFGDQIMPQEEGGGGAGRISTHCVGSGTLTFAHGAANYPLCRHCMMGGGHTRAGEGPGGGTGRAAASDARGPATGASPDAVFHSGSPCGSISKCNPWKRSGGGVEASGYTFIPLSAMMFPHMAIMCLTAEKVTSFKRTVVWYPICILLIWLPSVYLGIVAAHQFPGLKLGIGVIRMEEGDSRGGIWRGERHRPAKAMSASV